MSGSHVLQRGSAVHLVLQGFLRTFIDEMARSSTFRIYKLLPLGTVDRTNT